MSPTEHTHVRQGQTEGCPACDGIRPESQVHPHLVPMLPAAYWYSGCDCEAWPCGHEYQFHEECWVIGWLDATDLADTNDDWSARDDEGNWPDGVIDYEWTGEGVIWSYVTIDLDATQPTPAPDGRRDSDVPLWEDELQ